MASLFPVRRKSLENAGKKTTKGITHLVPAEARMNFTVTAENDENWLRVPYSVFAPKPPAVLFQKDGRTIEDLEHQFHWVESTKSAQEDHEQERRYS